MIAGLIIGFIGVFFLTFFNDSLQSTDKPLKGQWLGILVIIAGGIAWVSGSLKAKYSPAGGSLVANAAVQLLVSGLVCLLASVFTGEAAGFHFGQVSMRSLGGMIYLIVFGSIITYISYLWLLKKRSAAQVSTYVYVNPIVAIILGAIIAEETITVVQVVALTVILAGVFIVNRTKTKGEVPVEKEKKIVTSC
jgi:drug/metabolite transporter (DMT)-like permease